MGEKKGLTVKLIYPFPVQKCLEIELNGVWYRVTAGEFRSYNGRRRITIYYDENRNPIYEEYFGPIYKERTNTVISK